MKDKYWIKEIFYSIQGEGANTGRPSVFVRFAGCNLWSGHSQERETAICSFCDTDFADGELMQISDIKQKIASFYSGHGWPLVVLTGGEPLLQVDSKLVMAIKQLPVEIALETNGTGALPCRFDWVCFSPKGRSAKDGLLISGDELKYIYPQEYRQPKEFENLDFKYFWIQPMDGPKLKENTRAAIQFCLDNPKWRLGLQIHKFLGLR